LFSLANLLVLGLIGLVALYLWRSGEYTVRARELAREHCRRLDLQLLDDSVVITRIWPMRSASGRLIFRRSYRFEFASTGDRRYRGTLVLEGLQLSNIELDAYRLPPEDS
jgi:hypothetical protein